MKTDSVVKFIVSACTLLCTVGISAQINFEHEEWNRVKEQARAEHKIVFVDAYTTWCGPCKWMSKNVFTDPEVGEFFNANFINLKLDMEKGEGLEFAKEYAVNAYPSLLFVDGEGTLLHKHLGAVPADRFLQVGRDALLPEKRISNLIRQYESHKSDKEFLREYVMKMTSAGMDAQQAAHAYFDLIGEDEIASAENLQMIRMMQPSLDSKGFHLLYENREAFGAVAGSEMIDGLISNIATSGIYRAASGADADAYRQTRDYVSNLDIASKQMLLTLGDMVFSEAQGDIAGYLAYAEKYSKEYHWNESNALNNIAWDMYLNEDLTTSGDLKLAEKIAKRAVKLDANSYTTDTYAAVLYKMGKYGKALKWAHTAIDLAKASDSDYSTTAALVEKIEAARR